MIIYNTTYLVSDGKRETWMKWLTEIHIPAMLVAGFTRPQVAKLLSADHEQEGTSFAVQFHFQDLSRLKIWDKENAGALSDEITQRFGTEVLCFSTVLEIIL